VHLQICIEDRRGSSSLLKGFALAACGLLALASARDVHAGGTCANGVCRDGGPGTQIAETADPEFRLLVLGGRTVRWKIPAHGLPPTITYAFLAAPATFPGARNCDAMLPPQAALERSRIGMDAFRREVRAAFATWEASANISFKEVGAQDNAGILIGADAKARGRAFTNVALEGDASNGSASPTLSQGGMGAIRQSLICLNPLQPWKIGFDGNLEVYDLRFTLTHEIGHAIGLDHPSPEGELMSFRYVEKARGLQAGDIAGVVALYGRKGEGPAGTANVASGAAGLVPSQPAGGEPTFGLGEAPADRRPAGTPAR
jgi:hypothetical protein